MNLPSFPTDNLYKFMAIFGLVLFVVPYYYIITRSAKASEAHNKVVRLSEEYRSEVEKVIKRSKVIDSLESLNDGHAKDSINEENTSYQVFSETEALSRELRDVKNLNDNLSKAFAESEKDIGLDLSYIMAAILIMIGNYLMWKGFNSWYEKHQKYIDAEVKWRGEIFIELLDDEAEKKRIIQDIINHNSKGETDD